MSYPRDLDEYADYELVEELDRRARLRMNNFCTYCGQAAVTPPCKFPERHYESNDELLNRYLADLEKTSATFL